MQREEELHSEVEACGLRVRRLEEAVAEGGEREEELRRVVRAARLVTVTGLMLIVVLRPPCVRLGGYAPTCRLPHFGSRML